MEREDIHAFCEIIKMGNIILKFATQTVCVKLRLLVDSFNQLSGSYSIVTIAHAANEYFIHVICLLILPTETVWSLYGINNVIT